MGFVEIEWKKSKIKQKKNKYILCLFCLSVASIRKELTFRDSKKVEHSMRTVWF